MNIYYAAATKKYCSFANNTDVDTDTEDWNQLLYPEKWSTQDASSLYAVSQSVSE